MTRCLERDKDGQTWRKKKRKRWMKDLEINVTTGGGRGMREGERDEI